MDDTTAPVASPGWYSDGSGQMRWWDGSQWARDAAPVIPARRRVSAISVVGMVLGIIAFLGSYAVGAALFALTGLLCSILGMTDTRTGARSGRGMAIAGIVCSAAAVLSILGFIILRSNLGA